MVASLLGLLFMKISIGKKKKSGASSMEAQSTESVMERSGNGSTDTDIVIVGAGVAGAALAYTLGKDGRRVHVIERDLTEPDRIVGELLQPGGYLKLMELGLEDCVSQIDAQQVYGYALYNDGKSTKLSYPLEGFKPDVAGRSFHNGRFIQRMREKAVSLSNVRLEQGTVTCLVEEKGTIKGVQYKNTYGQLVTAYAPLTIVCDGCFSNLRRSLCKPKVEIPSCFVGLILEKCELPYKNHGHVILADPSPILFYPISSTEIRCLVDVPGQRVPSISNGEMNHYLKTVIAPQIPPGLLSAFMAAIEKGNIRTMTNRSMPATPQPTPGALLLGDAFNMRHPLTGGGMTVALSDIVVLRDLLRPLRDLNNAPALCKYLESFYTLRKPVASTINTLAGALYKVFCASPDPSRKEMRQACFDYLSLGGDFTNGPIALLSGLNPRPLSLVTHFFAVAIYGVGRLLLPFPSPKRMLIGARLISGASSIIFPIIKAEGIRDMFFPARKKKSGASSMEAQSTESVMGRSGNGSTDTDIVIVGAGVAGAALAYTLGKEGRRVHVIERDLTEPDRIVGELLQPGGYLKLMELGLEDCVSQIDSQQVYGYALYKDGKSTKLSYPLEGFKSEVAGRSFHNGRFIQKMREKAASLSNVRLEQGTVTCLVEEKGTIKGVQYKNTNGQLVTAYAPLTIVCDGCFSNLRRSLCKPKVEIPSCFVGLILEKCELPYKIMDMLYWQILHQSCSIQSAALRFAVWWMYLVKEYHPFPMTYDGIASFQIPPELLSAFMAAIKKGNIRTMTNRSMPATPQPTPGALLLGDAFNMRHPLTGGGMTVALSDIVVLRDLLRPLRDLNDAPALCKYLESFYTLRKPVASTINTLAGALYKVFCASPDPSRKEMRQACFDYLSLGGDFTNGPIALLSGLNPRPLSLVTHFFAVAIYGVGRLLLPFPSPKRMLIGARLISGASSIIFPIIKAEGVRDMFFPASTPAYYRASVN
ncbi:hypothetical protein LWI28_006705 [Acer negundo]|uniref:squalene monooxygenase n=1 Tax=Acer negundo TaxID=4023 RepID=A0AAD5NW13_ACENE|nr:hypothetical protein LWI28_006705 [Acer negundo]